MLPWAAYSVIANRRVRGGLNEKLSEVLTTFASTNSEKVKLNIDIAEQNVIIFSQDTSQYSK